MTAMLASVRTLLEVEQALAFGADLIDLKEPSAGALGALPPATSREAVRLVAGRRPVSATIGDLAMTPGIVADAVARAAAAGVDYVKVGFFPGGDHDACIRALGREAARGTRIVAVLLADRAPALGLAPRLASAGLAGVMLDTADKRGGSLRDHLDEAALAGFVAGSRASGLLVGLAGSLGQEDVAPLAALEPDYLGFRGALCARQQRAGDLDPGAFRAIREALDRAQASRASSATATAGRHRAAHSAASGAARIRLAASR